MPTDSKPQKRFGQRIPNHKTISALSDSEGYEPHVFTREIFLDYEQWQNIGEDKLPWYEYNHSSTKRTEIAAIQRLIIPCIREIITSGLTSRQREIIAMYFLYNRTQVFIARKLGISQPTVSQHLNGKKRNGKKIGGSIRKIRKIIHHLSSTHKTHQGQSYIIHMLGQLLDDTTTIRKSSELIQRMLK